MNEFTKDQLRKVLQVRINNYTELLNTEEAEIKSLKNLIHSKELKTRNLQAAILETQAAIKKI